MSIRDRQSTRRHALKTLGAGTAAALAGVAGGQQAATSTPATRPATFQAELESLITRTPMVDTHEHLADEPECLADRAARCDDWAVLLTHYINSDFIVAGLGVDKYRQFVTRGLDPLAKWRLIAPYWPAVKNTGYGRAVRITVKELYGIDDLSDQTIPRLQTAYESTRKAGFYRRILVDMAGIESCQVDSCTTFRESRQPTLLLQDINFVGMHIGPDIPRFARPAGRQVRALADWHAVIGWWFDKYAPYAAGAKSQAAYSRGLDYEQVPPEKAEPVFAKVLRKEPVSGEERKLLEDHLFWFVVQQATKHALPVKLHTGYYWGQNYMPLARVAGNAAQAGELCRKSSATTFVFMHIAYPFWQGLVAVAKHYPNAHVDMCWSWIIDPASAKEFLKSYLVAAPANKLLTFGGDYSLVECVLGHSRIARRGLARALVELVEEGWLEPRDAMELVEPLLRGNARRIFQLDAKIPRLARAPWLGK